MFAQGGIVTVAVPYLPTNFNPSTTAGSNRVTQMAMQQVLPQAFTIDPQYQPETNGTVDQAEVVSLHPMRVEYQLDPKAVWSDGVPITAADFTYNWHEQLAHESELPVAGPLVGYRDISAIASSNGGKTVTVTFRQAYADWESLFTNLIPAHIAERYGWERAFQGFDPAKLISGGPFEVAAFQPGRKLVLRRNPRYWGQPAHLSSIVFEVATSRRAVLRAMAHGQISLSELAPGEDVSVAASDAKALGNSLTSTTSSTPTLWQIVFNLHDALVGQRLLRKALADATSRAELVADSVGFTAPATPAAQSRLFGATQPGASDVNGGANVYSPAKAAALFETLGYAKGRDGYLRLDGVGPPLTLSLIGPSDEPVISRLELQLQAEWVAAGIRLEIHSQPLATLLGQTLPQGHYQLAIAPYSIPVFPTWNALLYTDSVLPPVTSTSQANVGVASRGVGTGRAVGDTTSTTTTSRLAGVAPKGGDDLDDDAAQRHHDHHWIDHHDRARPRDHDGRLAVERPDADRHPARRGPARGRDPQRHRTARPPRRDQVPRAARPAQREPRRAAARQGRHVAVARDADAAAVPGASEPGPPVEPGQRERESVVGRAVLGRAGLGDPAQSCSAARAVNRVGSPREWGPEGLRRRPQRGSRGGPSGAHAGGPSGAEAPRRCATVRRAPGSQQWAPKRPRRSGGIGRRASLRG